jgi:DNA-binding NarL/FixJ family response regulator
VRELPLSPRQRDIAEFVVMGWEDKAIALELGISESTVGNHLRVAYARLGVWNRVQFALMYYRATHG